MLSEYAVKELHRKLNGGASTLVGEMWDGEAGLRFDEVVLRENRETGRLEVAFKFRGELVSTQASIDPVDFRQGDEYHLLRINGVFGFRFDGGPQ